MEARALVGREEYDDALSKFKQIRELDTAFHADDISALEQHINEELGLVEKPVRVTQAESPEPPPASFTSWLPRIRFW